MRIILGMLTACLLTSALAHDHSRPELDSWFKGLQSTIGASCCDGSDAFSVLDPEWDTTTDEEFPFKVKFTGVWLKVSKNAVVKGPNKAGPAQLWPVQDEDGEMTVRCFLPGAGA